MTQADNGKDELSEGRERLYDSYASSHDFYSDVSATEIFVSRVLIPLLPVPVSGVRSRVVELGCGAGAVVQELSRSGFDVVGVDASPEQVALAQSVGLSQVTHGEAGSFLKGLGYAPDAIVALDFLEHFTKLEALDLLTLIRTQLEPEGVLVARLPNSSSPFFGRIQYGDLTHETAFSPRSISQALKVAGFSEVEIHPVNPIVHGLKSAGRAVVWKLAAATLRLMLTAETGIVRGHVVTQNMMVVARP